MVQTLSRETELQIRTLTVPAQTVCRRFLVAAQEFLDKHEHGLIIEVVSARVPFPADDPPSWACFGLSFRIGLYRSGKPVTATDAMYYAIGAVGTSCGLTWGTIPTLEKKHFAHKKRESGDESEYRLNIGIDLSEALRRHDAGTSLFDGTPYAELPPASDL